MLKRLSIILIVMMSSSKSFAVEQLEDILLEFNQQTLMLADWLKQKNYTQSHMLLTLSSIPGSEGPDAQELIDALDAGIDRGGLSEASWYRIAQFCNSTRRTGSPGQSFMTLSKYLAKVFDPWCQKKNISRRYVQADPDNAWAYLFRLNFEVDNPYNQNNLDYFNKAANARYMSSYWGRGLQEYTVHLSEYFQAHSQELVRFYKLIPDVAEVGTEDIFVAMRLNSISLMGIPGYSNLMQFCGVENNKTVPGAEIVRSQCLKIARLLDSNKNTHLEALMANAMMARLSEPGSKQQLEAERRRIVDKEVVKCLLQMSNEEDRSRIFLKTLPLLETYGEVEAMAIAMDQYYQALLQPEEGKPSSCFMLKDLDLEAARKMQAGSDKV